MGVKSRSIDLAGFYPVLCVRENGRWRTDAYTPFGDPFYSEISSFYVTLTAPADLAVACSGKALSRSVRDGFAVTTIAAERVRDFALSLSRDFRLSRASVRIGGGTVEINYHSLSDPAPESTLAAITYAVEEFSRVFGDYPYDTFTVAQTELVAGGMEYGSFAVISDAASGEALADIAVHETAHQWWFGVVGSDQLNSPWLDEGLAEFSVGYLRLLRGDEERKRRAANGRPALARGRRTLFGRPRALLFLMRIRYRLAERPHGSVQRSGIRRRRRDSLLLARHGCHCLTPRDIRRAAARHSLDIPSPCAKINLLVSVAQQDRASAS